MVQFTATRILTVIGNSEGSSLQSQASVHKGEDGGMVFMAKDGKSGL
jgi:hypothetical protein